MAAANDCFLVEAANDTWQRVKKYENLKIDLKSYKSLKHNFQRRPSRPTSGKTRQPSQLTFPKVSLHNFQKPHDAFLQLNNIYLISTFNRIIYVKIFR